ncbi:MAG: hypothetical protein ACKVOA_02645 [Methylophilaceae bacterium]
MKQAINILLASTLCLCMQFAYAIDGVIYKTATGLSFINGGISEEQADDIRRTANNFTLQVLFSGGPSGGWLTDVSFMILDDEGKTVFWKKQSGPILYIDLPAGNYQIIGRYNTDKQSVLISLSGEKPQRVILNWKDELSDLERASKSEE